MFVTSLLSAVLMQSASFSEDPEVLQGYIAHACRMQQASNRGGAAEDYTEFCDCLSADMAENSSVDLFRSMAIGSQASLGEGAMVDDWQAAHEESERIFGTLEPEEQLTASGVIQNGLVACLSLAPAQSE